MATMMAQLTALTGLERSTPCATHAITADPQQERRDEEENHKPECQYSPAQCSRPGASMRGYRVSTLISCYRRSNRQYRFRIVLNRLVEWNRFSSWYRTTIDGLRWAAGRVRTLVHSQVAVEPHDTVRAVGRWDIMTQRRTYCLITQQR
jgi:hypothetical protein